MSPSPSAASQPPSAGLRGVSHSPAVSARWSPAVPSSAPVRVAGSFTKYAKVAASAGSRTRASRLTAAGSRSFLELAELGRRDGVELPVDVEEHDPHHEHADEHVEQHAGVHQEGDPPALGEAEDVDPVLEHQVAH